MLGADESYAPTCYPCYLEKLGDPGTANVT